MMKSLGYESHQKYKESGIDWIEQIPAHWVTMKAKFLLRESSSRSVSGEENLLSLSKYHGVIRKDQMSERAGQAETLVGYKEVKSGDLVINKMQASIGLMAVSQVAGITSPDYSIYKAKNNGAASTNYICHILRQPEYLGEIKRRAKGVMEGFIRLYTDDLFDLPIILPPHKEQQRILAFLDDKCAKIDEAVKIKEDQIALLRERRQIIIQDAVTRGLNPTARMKESGIDWIGQLPEHWSSKLLRHAFNFHKGLTITKENLQEDGIPCVNYGEIHSKYGFEVDPSRHPLKCVDLTYLKNNEASLLKRGDFVFADTSEDIEGSGNFTYFNSDINAFAGYHTVIAKPKVPMNDRFMAYLMDSRSFRTQVRTEVKGVKVFSISQSILKNTVVWFPPSNEQASIVAYLDSKCSQIDGALKMKEEQIAALKEYKTSLINAAVTGKIKVV
jgi:type I restriction enzyme S subunit